MVKLSIKLSIRVKQRSTFNFQQFRNRVTLFVLIVVGERAHAEWVTSRYSLSCARLSFSAEAEVAAHTRDAVQELMLSPEGIEWAKNNRCAAPTCSTHIHTWLKHEKNKWNGEWESFCPSIISIDIARTKRQNHLSICPIIFNQTTLREEPSAWKHDRLPSLGLDSNRRRWSSCYAETGRVTLCDILDPYYTQ